MIDHCNSTLSVSIFFDMLWHLRPGIKILDSIGKTLEKIHNWQILQKYPLLKCPTVNDLYCICYRRHCMPYATKLAADIDFLTKLGPGGSSDALLCSCGAQLEGDLNPDPTSFQKYLREKQSSPLNPESVWKRTNDKILKTLCVQRILTLLMFLDTVHIQGILLLFLF